jgi:hypothetical protein
MLAESNSDVSNLGKESIKCMRYIRIKKAFSIRPIRLAELSDLTAKARLAQALLRSLFTTITLGVLRLSVW